MKKLNILLLGTILLGICSCHQEPHFNIKGNIHNAAGQTLYLEQSGIEDIILLDSARLNSSGTYSFKGKRPESPEFYRLRVGNRIINFSADSTETIEIHADLDNFSTQYSVKGSENSEKIKELTLLQMELQKQVDNLVRHSRSKRMPNDLFEDSLITLINHYKDTVKRNYIFSAPNKPYAYYALFQKVNDYLLFDPLNNREDIKCFGAVATSMNNAYPHADRSKNLYNIVIKGMKNTRIPKQQEIELPENKISETGIIDISLPDLKGNIRKLSDLKGKVVLLDFIIYQSAIASPHNIALNELYQKYAPQGLEIYQISLDADEHFWKTTADKLPWVCVRDENGIYSNVPIAYNVQKLPTYFLINRNSELNNRDENIKDLEKELKKLL